MHNTSKFTTIIAMLLSCILCSCSNTVATERITFYSSSDQVTQDPQPEPYVTLSLNPKPRLKNMQRKSLINPLPVLVFGGIVIIGIIVAIIGKNRCKGKTDSESLNTPAPPTSVNDNKDTDNKSQQDNNIPVPLTTSLSAHNNKTKNNNNKDTITPKNETDPSPLESLEELQRDNGISFKWQRAVQRRFIRKYVRLLNFWENWKGVPEEKEEFTNKMIFTAFNEISDIQNTDLVGSTVMARALNYCLTHRVKNLLVFTDANVLATGTNEQMVEDCIKMVTIANDIRDNAKQYAQFILPQQVGVDNALPITTSDRDIISFLPTKDDHVPLHTITLEGLTNYLKWCSDQLRENANSMKSNIKHLQKTKPITRT